MIAEDSQRGSYFFGRFQRAGPLGDARNLTRIDTKGFAIEQEPQVFHPCLFKGALLGFEKEGFLFEEIENVVYYLSMEGGVIRSGDQDVVHVNENHIGVFEFKGSEDAVHHTLEGCGSITLPEEHDHRFEESEGRFERRLPLVAVSDVDVVVPPSDVELRKKTFPSEIPR